MFIYWEVSHELITIDKLIIAVITKKHQHIEPAEY
jgi:hypothetical protein